MLVLASRLLAVSAILTGADAACFDPSPAFPVPQWGEDGLAIRDDAFGTLQDKLSMLLAASSFNASSASVEITSSTKTIWSWHHSARQVNESRPGVRHVDGQSQYRIASITKTFTVLAILYEHSAGLLHLDDPVVKYISEFAREDSGALPWKDITLRALASQLSGIPREFAQGDLLASLSNPVAYGLPPSSTDVLTPCLRYPNKTCTAEELLEQVKDFQPLFAPNQKSTYSNLNYEILGIVLERVTGKTYEDYITEKVFEPLEMTSSSLSTPPDEHAVLPAVKHWFDRDLGVQKPTGGIYSSSSDLSRYLRYVLTHYNSLATGVNWFNPGSFGRGPSSYYGMPWETFRSSRVLVNRNRDVTFINKGGAVPGYYSTISLLPDYDLGFTVLTAGDEGLLVQILELVTVTIIRAAEEVIWSHMNTTYSGTYKSRVQGLNSSIVVKSSPSTGLVIDNFISNSTDVFKVLIPAIGESPSHGSWRAQLVPTLLYKDEKEQAGEIFRLALTSNSLPSDDDSIWSQACNTDLDVPGNYANLPLNELVYWHHNQSFELPAWKVTLERMQDENEYAEERPDASFSRDNLQGQTVLDDDL